MKVAWLRRTLANRWLWTCAFWGLPLCIGLAYVMPFYLAGGRLIPMMFVGAAIGVFLTYFALRGLHRVISKMNGAPFHVDDVVHVLTGKYRGHIGRVYSVSEERRQERVYVSKEAERIFEDLFSSNEVCRANSVDRDAWQEGHRRDD